jgi:molecular chaperone GrpE
MTEEKIEEKPTEEDLEGAGMETPDAEDAAPAETAEQDIIEDLKAELAATEKAGKEFEDRYMRLCAEFENYKKRSAREAQDFRKFANEALIKDLLPVIDNLERAIQSSSPQENHPENFNGSIIEGVQMTLNEILKVLERFHAKPIDSLGQPFDPNYHEAVGQEESDEHEDNIVVREFQRGYLLHDRLIRPAMVMVSKAVSKPAAAENEPTDNENENPNGAE